MEHNQEILDSLNDHIEKKTGTRPKEPEPKPKPLEGNIAKKNNSADDTADLRDSISILVGRGYTGLTDDDSKANFKRISNIIGQGAARDLLSHILIQNQRPELQGATPDARLTHFYDINSSNAPVQDILQKVKSFGSGTAAGFHDSVNKVAQQIQGNDPNSGAVMDIKKQSELQKKAIAATVIK